LKGTDVTGPDVETTSLVVKCDKDVERLPMMVEK
jgi:hypothetical protein